MGGLFRLLAQHKSVLFKQLAFGDSRFQIFYPAHVARALAIRKLDFHRQVAQLIQIAQRRRILRIGGKRKVDKQVDPVEGINQRLGRANHILQLLNHGLFGGQKRIKSRDAGSYLLDIRA